MVCGVTGCRASAIHVEGVFTRVQATVLLAYLSVATTRMDPQGSHIGVRMDNNNNTRSQRCRSRTTPTLSTKPRDAKSPSDSPISCRPCSSTYSAFIRQFAAYKTRSSAISSAMLEAKNRRYSCLWFRHLRMRRAGVNVAGGGCGNYQKVDKGSFDRRNCYPDCG